MAILAVADSDDAVLAVDASDVETDYLGNTQARRVGHTDRKLLVRRPPALPSSLNWHRPHGSRKRQSADSNSPAPGKGGVRRRRTEWEQRSNRSESGKPAAAKEPMRSLLRFGPDLKITIPPRGFWKMPHMKARQKTALDHTSKRARSLLHYGRQPQKAPQLG